MHFGYMTYLVKLEGINSLKEKRGVIRPVFQRPKKNFNASIVKRDVTIPGKSLKDDRDSRQHKEN